MIASSQALFKISRKALKTPFCLSSPRYIAGVSLQAVAKSLILIESAL